LSLLPAQEFVVGAARPAKRIAFALWIDGAKQGLQQIGSSERFITPALVLQNVPLQGVSHAEWPKDKHESAAKETGNCWPFTAVDIECAPSSAAGLSQCEKKL
jgi:hypothetical protein